MIKIANKFIRTWKVQLFLNDNNKSKFQSQIIKYTLISGNLFYIVVGNRCQLQYLIHEKCKWHLLNFSERALLGEKLL
jgi:hypothetical protein